MRLLVHVPTGAYMDPDECVIVEVPNEFFDDMTSEEVGDYADLHGVDLEDEQLKEID